jgi:predicted phosphodiesterase
MPKNKMESIYSENEQIGRKKLARLARVTENQARWFLMQKRRFVVNEDSFMSGLNEYEQDLIKRGLQGPKISAPVKHEWAKDSFKFAAMGDTHWGHQLSHSVWWDKTCDLIEKEQCDFVLHTGDLTEGMSGRPGHCYELEAIGATAQLDLAESRLKRLPCHMRGITGNHDLWGNKAIGLDPGVVLAGRCPNFEYLGQNEATIEVGGVKIMLSHPGDGSAYAISYQLQQFINALSGGEKPHILLMGHHHKSIYFQYRNVQGIETGTLCAQTGWMRGKKLQVHCGFWIVEVWPNGGGIERIKTEWIPFFTE